ncbi:MAG: methionyl-tRNA formyltransferase [Phycisphaerae bacterium]
MKILFLASGAFAVPSLRTLAADATNEIAVITQPDRPAGRGRQPAPTPAAEEAGRLGLPVIKIDSANSLLPRLPLDKPDLHVVIAFGQKLSEEFVAAARLGAINLHGSLLPRFRGAAPIQWSILSGDAHGGVTVIRVAPIMDGGAILARRSTPIRADETAGELHDRLAELGVGVLCEAMNNLALGVAVEEPQDETQATRAPKLSRAMAWVDFSKPAGEVSCRIRGLSPWPGCRAVLMRSRNDKSVELQLLKAAARSISHSQPPGVFLDSTHIACGSGAIELLTVQPRNRGVMAMIDFINGHHIEIGDRLISEAPAPH